MLHAVWHSQKSLETFDAHLAVDKAHHLMANLIYTESPELLSGGKHLLTMKLLRETLLCYQKTQVSSQPKSDKETERTLRCASNSQRCNHLSLPTGALPMCAALASGDLVSSRNDALMLVCVLCWSPPVERTSLLEAVE